MYDACIHIMYKIVSRVYLNNLPVVKHCETQTLSSVVVESLSTLVQSLSTEGSVVDVSILEVILSVSLHFNEK